MFFFICLSNFSKSMMMILLLMLSTAVFAAPRFKLFPFEDSLEDRSEDILTMLRSKMDLDTSDKTILKSFDAAGENGLFLNNLEGVPFSIQKKTTKDVKKPNQDYLYDANKLSAMFDGTCSALGGEYWNYEWCHRRGVNQYHVEKVGDKIVKNPNWSLGKYKKIMVVREHSTNEKSSEKQEKMIITTMIEHFHNGQMCDETNQPRSTSVHIQCCDDLSYPNIISSDEYYAKLDEGKAIAPKAVLVEIMEPSLCTYQATVCSPIMCSRNKTSHSARAGAAASSKALESNKRSISMTHLMHITSSLCLTKSENWWTYELCFNKGIRQVHFDVEQVVNAEGATIHKQVISNQYNLGNAPVELYDNETALLQRTRYQGQWEQSQRGSNEEQVLWSQLGMLAAQFTRRSSLEDQDYMSLEFRDGTLCDLDQSNRSTIIDLHCGKQNALIQIREVSTCRYRAKVELPLLCHFPGFGPQKENVTTLIWKPLVDESDADGENASNPTEAAAGSQPSGVLNPASASSDALQQEASMVLEIVVDPTASLLLPPSEPKTAVLSTPPESSSRNEGEEKEVSEQHEDLEGSRADTPHQNNENKETTGVSIENEALPEELVSGEKNAVSTEDAEVEEELIGTEEDLLLPEEEYSFPPATDGVEKIIDPQFIAMIHGQLAQSFGGAIPPEVLDKAVKQVIASLQQDDDVGTVREIFLSEDGVEVRNPLTDETLTDFDPYWDEVGYDEDSFYAQDNAEGGESSTSEKHSEPHSTVRKAVGKNIFRPTNDGLSNRRKQSPKSDEEGKETPARTAPLE